MSVINWPQEFQWNPSIAAVGNHNNVIKCRMVNMYKIILCVSIIVCLVNAGPAESVRLLRFWPDQFLLKVKAKFHFCKRQVINKVLVWFWDLLGFLY